jgi:hypothetical protein
LSNCYWGGPDVSLEAAKIMNDDMAAAQTAWTLALACHGVRVPRLPSWTWPPPEHR